MDLGAPSFKSGSIVNFALNTPALHGVRALVLVGGRTDAERFGEFPLALLDVLGRSVLVRTLDRIRAAGIGHINVLSDTCPPPPSPASNLCKFSVANPDSFWDEALHQFRHLSLQSEFVLVLRLGAWAEINFAVMVQEHRRSGSAITRACSQRGEALDVFVVSSAGQSEAAALLRGELRDGRIASAEHKTRGYLNMLRTPADLRCLTLDAFAGESAIRPCGRELRPGVWIGAKVRIHREARILAPAFIGDYCKVRRGVLITRGSSLEHHSEVDCATVIDNSSLMPHTRVGAGLELEYSVVGFHQVHSQPRNVTVNIEDPQLIGVTTTRFSVQLLPALNWLLTSLPTGFWRSFFERRPNQIELSAPVSLAPPVIDDVPLATADSQTKSYPEMAATRRYGNE